MSKNLTQYKVTGQRPFRGHLPGETFEAELDPAHERRAVGRGAIRVVKRPQTDGKAS